MEFIFVYFDNNIMEEYWRDEELIANTLRSLPKIIPQPQSHALAFSSKKSVEEATKESSNHKKLLAGQKSRAKKKAYLKSLEDNVKSLTSQIQKYEKEIYQCKDKLVEALRTSPNHTNQHTSIYAELERNISAEDPDLDKINLLIDIIRNRIGANGKERQANINYAFKQAVNSIFPAIYRYILNTAHQSKDLFAPHPPTTDPTNWTYELYTNLDIQDQQARKLNQMRKMFTESREEAVSHINQLNTVRQAIKCQAQVFQNVVEQRLGSIRSEFNPIQCALITIFAEKNKLRREFSIHDEFEEYGKTHKILKRE